MTTESWTKLIKVGIDMNKQSIKQFIQFCMVGGTNLVAAYIFYYFALNLTENLFVANFAGYFFSTINSFLWNNIWVFRKDENETRNPWLALLKLFITYAATGIVLNYFLLLLWVDVLGVTKLIAPIFNSIIDIPINFFVSKLWCFKTKKKGK